MASSSTVCYCGILILLATWYQPAAAMGIKGRSGLCIDNNPSCKGWADLGQCQKNPLYMLENCKSSCNICTMGRSGLCIDNNPSCKGWADLGQCQENPSYMLVNCKSACNNCPMDMVTPAPEKCAEGILDGDTFDANGCRQECKDGQISINLERCGPIIRKECDPGALITDKDGDTTVYCSCQKGIKQCRQPPSPGCVGEEIWEEVFEDGCFFCSHCEVGQWGEPVYLCENQIIIPPRELAPLIPVELNECKVVIGGKQQFAEYNEACKMCEHCEACHVFNTRTCGCRKQPFCGK